MSKVFNQQGIQIFNKYEGTFSFINTGKDMTYLLASSTTQHLSRASRECESRLFCSLLLCRPSRALPSIRVLSTLQSYNSSPSQIPGVIHPPEPGTCTLEPHQPLATVETSSQLHRSQRQLRGSYAEQANRQPSPTPLHRLPLYF